MLTRGSSLGQGLQLEGRRTAWRGQDPYTVRFDEADGAGLWSGERLEGERMDLGDLPGREHSPGHGHDHSDAPCRRVGGGSQGVGQVSRPVGVDDLRVALRAGE